MPSLKAFLAEVPALEGDCRSLAASPPLRADATAQRLPGITSMIRNLGSLCLHVILTKAVFQNHLRERKSSLISKNMWAEVEEVGGRNP